MPAAAIAIAALALLSLLPAPGRAEDAKDELRTATLAEMQVIAQETKVEFAEGSGEMMLVPKAVFRYDDQPRRLVDATVWAWTHRGRPVAFQKIEALERTGGASEWQHCFASLAEDRLRVSWKDGRSFESTEPGVVFRPVDESPPVARRGLDRRRQLRELARSFTARIVPNASAGDSQEMRLLSTPIFEFETEKPDLLHGAVFGYSTNGTNPDLVIVFEPRMHKGEMVWHYAPARMTIGGITLRHRDTTVWEVPFIEPGQNEFPTWTYFQTRREITQEGKP